MSKVSVEKLERVLWRIRKKLPNEKYIPNIELKRAIMMECGTDPKTYYNNRKALITLGWIISWKKTKVKLTDKDING